MPAPVALSKLSDVVKNDFVKKTVYDKLVTKKIVLILLFLKVGYDTDKSELGNKTPDIIGLVKKTDCNAKITEIEIKYQVLVV